MSAARNGSRSSTSATESPLQDRTSSVRLTRRSEQMEVSRFSAETLLRKVLSSSTPACPKEMFKAVLKARPFDSEEECLDAVLKHKVEKGDAVFIRYEGPKGSGMPEMFYTSEAISSDKELGRSIALITDGRFSGASQVR